MSKQTTQQYSSRGARPCAPTTNNGDNEKVDTKKRNPLLTALIVFAVVALAAFLVKRISDSIIPDVPGVTLTDVHTIEDLRSRFNQDQGAPRLVLLVSPT